MLLDSNIIIYAIQPDYGKLRNWITNNNVGVSSITLLEVLGYHNLKTADKHDFEELFSYAEIYAVTHEVIERAIDFRQRQNMSIGDTIIAATAVTHDKTLVTRNVSDFESIEELKLLDILAELG